MATYTTHYNLKKPALADKIRIADFNGNADTIDGQMYDNETLISKLKADIGIVENTNTATHNISAGQYVIWKGELYTANDAISSGATLSSANLTAVSNGGLNSLNSKLPTKSSNTLTTSNLSSNISVASASYVKNGRIAIITLSCTANTDVAVGNDVTFKISGMKSYGGGYSAGYSGNTCGVVKLTAGTGNDMNVSIRITGSAFLNQYSFSSCVPIIVDE